jgi:hypothetical protein
MAGSLDSLLGKSIVLSDKTVYGDPTVPLPEFASFPIVHKDPGYMKQVRSHCDLISVQQL